MALGFREVAFTLREAAERDRHLRDCESEERRHGHYHDGFNDRKTFLNI